MNHCASFKLGNLRNPLYPQGGAKEQRRTERLHSRDQGGIKHLQLSSVDRVCSRGAAVAGSRLHPVCDSRSSEQLQGDDPVRTVTHPHIP